MCKLKTALLSAGTVAVGVVTLRAVRKRRSTPQDEAKTAAEKAVAESKAATEHAAAAAGHARVAGEKTIEYAREELKTATANKKIIMRLVHRQSAAFGRLSKVGFIDSDRISIRTIEVIVNDCPYSGSVSTE